MSDVCIRFMPITLHNDNKIVLLARDPHWLYAFWEISIIKTASVKTLARSSGRDLFCIKSKNISKMNALTSN